METVTVFTVHPGRAEPARVISLADAGLKERADLQEWVRAHPEILGSDVRIVTFEFSGWQSRSGSEADRLDLLGIDAAGHLVVAELKRGVAPDTVEMQAIKYAAFASRFTPETLAESHAAYLTKTGGLAVSAEEARAVLEDHIGGELAADVLRRPRIVLVASDFPPQVTAAAVWLGEMGVDITLVQFTAYQAEHDIIVAVTQLWPQREVAEFTVSPRQALLRQAEEQGQHRRETNAITTLIADGVLADGTILQFKTAALPLRAREAVTGWIAEDERRGRATWHNDSRAPLVWEFDGEPYSATALARIVVESALQGGPETLAGPRYWMVEGGETLAQLAGFGAAARDWSDLHRVLGVVAPGEWTTYSDLAEVIGSGARPVGKHIADCAVCPSAYRVLGAGGVLAANFRWTDPADTRDPRAVLEGEGLAFPAGVADASRRVRAGALKGRLTSTGQ